MSDLELPVMCTRDRHQAPVPVVVFRWDDQAEGWAVAGPGLHRHGNRNRQLAADRGDQWAPFRDYDDKLTFRCPECRDELQIGAGRWDQLDAALVLLAGTPATAGGVALEVLRGAYARILRRDRMR